MEKVEKKVDIFSTLPVLTCEEKMQALRDVKLFILDNSLRETSVASLKGHTLDCKQKIMYSILGCGGINHAIVGCFSRIRRVDDDFTELILKEKKNFSNLKFYCFAEVFSEEVDYHIDTRDLDKVSYGLQRALKYGIKNVVLEFDVLCQHSANFDIDKMCGVVWSRVEWIRKNLSPDSLIFINLRDFCDAWKQKPHYIERMIIFLSTREHQIFGLLMEDPSGGVFPCEVGRLVHASTTLMREHSWGDGHFLVHIHQGFGLAEASVTESLMHGATGIWCGVCRDGAATGQVKLG